MNTTKGATNPPMPPADVGDWDEVANRYWESGDFRIDCVRSDRFLAALLIGQNGEAVELGAHPSVTSAVSACRDVAGALQRARRHDTTK